MAALTKDRKAAERDGTVFRYPVAAGKKIYAGSHVVLSATGYAEPAVAAPGLASAGCAQEQVDNTLGADGDVTVTVKRGVFKLANATAADELTEADVGQRCFGLDDQTVGKTDGNSGSGPARSVAGRVLGVDDDGVWVELGRPNGELRILMAAAGAAAAGAVTLTGAKVGDKVKAVQNFTDGAMRAHADFESVITVADEIQQVVATDLSAKKLVVFLVAKS